MPWVGMRTANIDGAHIEYFRGISNPIGVKVGAAMSAEWLQELVHVLNPQNEPGRLTFIHRFGIKDIEQRLPAMIKAVRDTGSQVLWVCDPMAWQYRDHRRRSEDPPLRQYSGRSGGGLSHP